MRIIDADRAKEIADTSFGDFLLSLAMRNLLDRVPTEDAAPVLHGHWFLTEVEYLNCSVCGEAYYTGIQTWSAAQDNLKYAGGHKYCPNCGAKMDERSQEQ
jgi:hypothetical protein